MGGCCRSNADVVKRWINDMNMLAKRVAFLLLAIACFGAALLLFLPGLRESATSTQRPLEPVRSDAPAATDNRIRADAAPSAPEDAAARADWNTYHGDSALTGVTDTNLPDALEKAWETNVGESVEQPPVSASGRIFAATSKGGVIALDMGGKLLWRHEITPNVPEGQQPLPLHVDAPLACFVNMVLIGTDDGMLTALQADTGQPLWQARIEGYVHGTPNYDEASGSIIVLEQETGILTAIDPATGGVRWRTDGVDRADGSPAVAAACAVYGSCASALHVVSTKDGARLRDIKIESGGGQVAGGVALFQGMAHAGCRDGRVVQADLEKGVLTWVQPVSTSEVFSTPAVRGEQVVVASLDGNLHALDLKTGAIQWKHEVGGEPGSPVIAGDKVLLSSDDTLFLVNLADGTRRWELRMPGFITPPAVLPGLVVIGCEDGTITAFKPGAGPKKDS